MGLVDRVYVRDERCVCSEGHSLADIDFETKDLGCTMGEAHIVDGRMTFEPDRWGDRRDRVENPVTARIWMCTFCPQCPSFKTKYSTLEHLVAFVMHVENGKVTSMERISAPLSEWLQEDYVREAAASA